MYLKRLEMKGFKSFVDSELNFQPGTTMVVGPNGSGKSNILDAILWVLGEQSTKTLRSERMEDVIFNGTETRNAHGMTEVSLILGGINGGASGGEGAPVVLPHALDEYQEVMVTRRLFRDGVSDYFLNKVPCRLKDIRGLLLDTRAGSKGHTVIEQGMIERLLKASPVERRELIEETAGIIRYKKQKAEALRKLDATQQNLLRVRDIVNEVKRQLGSVERQARAAETYQALRQEVRRLELIVLIHEYREVGREREESDRLLSELSLREASEEAAAARFSADMETLRLETSDGETAMAALRDQAGQIEARLTQAATAIELMVQRASFLEEQRTRVQADLLHVQGEQADAKHHLAELHGLADTVRRELELKSRIASEVEAAVAETLRRYRTSQASLEEARAAVMQGVMALTEMTNRFAHDQARTAELHRAVERLEQERIRAAAALESTTTAASVSIERRREIEAQLTAAQTERAGRANLVLGLKTKITELERQASRLQEELTVAAARQAALRAVMQEAAGQVGSGSAPVDPERQTLAQVLTVPAEYEGAIEAALGHRLLGVVTETPAEAVQMLGILKAQGAGAGLYLPRRPRFFRTHAPPRFQSAGVRGWALELVTPVRGYEELVAHLLADVIIVDTLDDAQALWPRMTETAQAVLVTLSGEILGADGIVSSPPGGVTVGSLGRERELRALAARITELDQEIQEVRTQREHLESRLVEEAARLEGLDAELRGFEMALVGERKDEERGEQDTAQWQERLQLIESERVATQAELAALVTTEAAAREQVRQLESARLAAEALLHERQAAVAGDEAAAHDQQAQLSQARLESAGLSERLKQLEAESARTQATSELREVRLRELEAEIERLEAASANTVAERRQTETGVPAIEAELEEARGRLWTAQEAQAARVGALRALEADWARLRQKLEELHREQEAIRLRRMEAQVRLEGYDAQLRGTYGVGFEAAVAEIGDPDAQPLPLVRETLAQRRERLQELGPVNVMAIEEHRELEERVRFLTTQEADLAQAVASLKAIITRINKTTKQLFLETFEELQTKFDEMFKNFFEGGRAELILVEDEEGIEPGVDIVAQPPGKRLKNITMLSGGERALTAMALLFASFLIRPTPFCVLDEIDAALDEENTLRFTRVLQTLSARSQFIIITHSKQTMEVADSLYGVTMEEPGVSALVSVRLNRLLEPV